MDNNLVLIVEDEPAIARILEGYLLRDGFRTVQAADGETALQHHMLLKPDLVLLDVRIPKLDGLGVLARLRQTSSTPVIMVTALADDLDRLSGLHLGADDYVVKPFNPQEVVARVKAVLRRTLGERQDSVRRFREIEVDFSARVTASPSSTREVSSLVETFNALATSLDRMEERLRFNNMAIAHELRTPLTILQGALQGMVDGVFPMDRKIVSDLLLQVEGLGKIVEDLRTLSLAIGQKLVMQRQPLDVAAVVETVLAAAKPMLDASRMTVESRLQPARISADPSRIRQAVLALLENTSRYAQSGGWLRCETERLADESVIIRILDRGPGFPEDMDAIAVNPFWRGDPSRSRATGGTGLGLSVVQAIATAHGGHLEFTNRQGGGAVVTVHLRPE